MNRYYNRNKDNIEVRIDNPLNSLAKLGGTIAVDQDFDIKNFLNSIEEGESTINKKQINNNILNTTSQFTTFNSNLLPKDSLYNGYLTTFNNIPSMKFKTSGASFSTDLNKKKYLNTTSSTYIDYKYNNKKKNRITNTNTNNNFLSTKNKSK